MITFGCLVARTFPKFAGDHSIPLNDCVCPSDDSNPNNPDRLQVSHNHQATCGLYRNPRFNYFDNFELNDELVVVFNDIEHRVCASCFLDTAKKIKPDKWYRSGQVASRGNVKVVLEFGELNLVQGQAIIDAIESIIRICVPPAVNTDHRILGGRVAINESGAYVTITSNPHSLET